MSCEETPLERVRLDLHLETPRLILRDLRREDLDEMDGWRPLTDPLHKLWNLPRGTHLGRDLWLAVHEVDDTRLWFVVERQSDSQVVGTVSLRDIMRPASARLGVSFGADFLDQGYGTEALAAFLPYYFHTLGFQRLILDVAATNKRAVHVYEKLGFRRAGQHYRNIPSGEDLSFLEQEEFADLRPCFRRRLGHTQMLFYDMTLERRDWEIHSPERAP